jgi:hypothetical protein
LCQLSLRIVEWDLILIPNMKCTSDYLIERSTRDRPGRSWSCVPLPRAINMQFKL